MTKKLRTVPDFKTDEEAEAFLNQDLSDLDYSKFVPMWFKVKKKEPSTSVNVKIPVVLKEAVKEKAKEMDMPYSSYVRMILEQSVHA